ncbi:nucleotidyltransferase domain-containing protein [Leekyejoonella antrihumi]|uniref:nucleotidyltransferase domain-containing protein n=1 Tax=Leekyejoonella antrihumi TaxID=1660198 RepID=UPI001FE52EEF|nr:nucleotidyltransferase domain-containing protein [Leekyejoonella antrihumi]
MDSAQPKNRGTTTLTSTRGTGLRVFGSVITSRFDPDRSDIDFLVDFLPAVHDLLGHYLALNEELARIVGCKVDLVMSDAVETHTSRLRPSGPPRTSMRPRSDALLWDLETAAKRIQGFVAGKSWQDYSNDVVLRSGVERQFEIAGEALNVLRHIDAATADRVPNVH